MNNLPEKSEHRIFGIITFHHNGTRRPCGQIVGADGRGNKAIVIEALSVERAMEEGNKLIKEMMDNQEYPNQITNIVFVLGYDSFGGNPIYLRRIDE